MLFLPNVVDDSSYCCAQSVWQGRMAGAGLQSSARLTWKPLEGLGLPAGTQGGEEVTVGAGAQARRSPRAIRMALHGELSFDAKCHACEKHDHP